MAAILLRKRADSFLRGEGGLADAQIPVLAKVPHLLRVIQQRSVRDRNRGCAFNPWDNVLAGSVRIRVATLRGEPTDLGTFNSPLGASRADCARGLAKRMGDGCGGDECHTLGPG